MYYIYFTNNLLFSKNDILVYNIFIIYTLLERLIYEILIHNLGEFHLVDKTNHIPGFFHNIIV